MTCHQNKKPKEKYKHAEKHATNVAHKKCVYSILKYIKFHTSLKMTHIPNQYFRAENEHVRQLKNKKKNYYMATKWPISPTTWSELVI